MTTSSSDERGAGRVPISTLITIAFLAMSLGMSLFLLLRAQQSSLPVPQTVAATVTPTGSSPSIMLETSPPPSSTNFPETATKTPESKGIVVALSPVQGGDPAIADGLETAITQALSTTPLAEPVQVVRDVAIPSGVKPESMNLTADMPGVDMLVTWGRTSDGLQEIWINLASEPPMASLEGDFDVWFPLTSGDLAILVNPEGGLDLPSEVIIACLELQQGELTNAVARLRDLQSSTLDELPTIRDSQQVAIQLMLSAAEAKNGQALDALQTASQAVRLQDGSWMAHLNRGSIYLQLGDATSALSEFDTALEQVPEYWPAIYNRVIANVELGQFEAAMTDAQALQANQPESGWAANLVGVILYQQDDLDAAKQQFQVASDFEPTLETPLLNLAITLGKHGDFEAAIMTYDRLLDISPNSSLYYRDQALMYQAEGKYPQAEFRLNRAIEIDPGDFTTYLLRGELHLQMEAYDRARTDAQLALGQNQDSGEAYAILGKVALVEEDFMGAKDAFTQSIELGDETADIYQARGWAWHRLRYTGFAIADYEEALALGFSDSQLFLRLGFACLDAGRYEDALDALLGAINLGLDTPEAHAGLAIALDRNGKSTEANTEYQQALDQDSRYSDPEFLAQQPMWTSSIVQLASIILDRTP